MKPLLESPRIEFFAHGTPAPQGSLRAFVRNGHTILTSDNRRLKPWRSEVASCALARMEETGSQAPLFTRKVPVSLDLTFYFQKPKSTPRKQTSHIVRPDVDKAIRGILDSLTGILYHDDAQVTEIVARKRYDSIEGVRIIAREAL